MTMRFICWSFFNPLGNFLNIKPSRLRDSSFQLAENWRRTLMVAVSQTFPSEKPKAFRAIFWRGLIAGVLDITAAFVNSGLRGRSPVWVLQSVAGG
jgi:hypothetical protein